jgi:hypothetical protein
VLQKIGRAANAQRASVEHMAVAGLRLTLPLSGRQGIHGHNRDFMVACPLEGLVMPTHSHYRYIRFVCPVKRSAEAGGRRL